jgi:hypothetical protein
MDLAVETHGLTRRFGELTAVNGIDLAVPRGSLYGFLGPNGAGKSTTIKCLTSFLHRVELFRAALDPIFLLVFFAFFSALLSLGMQMLLRDGRRGKLATVLLLLGLSAAGVVPQFFAHEHRTARARLLVTTAPAPVPPSGRPAPAGPEPALEIPAALRFLPSGLYAAGVSAAGARRGAAMGLDLGSSRF